MKKSISLLFALLLLSVVASALPGVKQYTPDFSGEYVFYRDKSFTTPSVVGFVYYNASTYGARYYCPADAKKQSAPRDISIYYTVDAENGSIEMTGERITGSDGSQDDADIVNYLHDLFYELAERRQKQDLQSAQPLVVSDDFVQFGGAVKITYNNVIPIFNVEKITAADGDAVLEVETIGALTSSGDSSFAYYKGVEGLPKDRERTTKLERGKRMPAQFGSQSVSIDSSWQKNMDNIWFLGDSALLSLTDISAPQLFKDSPEQYQEILLKKLSESTELSFSLWKHYRAESKGNTVKLTSVFYQPEKGDVTRDFKILTKKADGNYTLLSLTVFDSVYQKNRSYFNKILKSYKAE